MLAVLDSRKNSTFRTFKSFLENSWNANDQFQN